MKTVVCPGSFDPFTNGHLDIIKRAAELFDKVIVLVANNAEKRYVFSEQERLSMIDRVLRADVQLENVEVCSYDGLLVDFVRDNKVDAIVRGLRAVSDFEYEFQMALTNRKLYGGCETLFFTPAVNNMYLSSSIVRQVGSFGGDISAFVPECIHKEISERLLNIKKIK